MLSFTICCWLLYPMKYTRYCYCLPFMAGYTMKYTPLLLISTFLLSSIITISYDYSVMIGCTTNNTHEWDIPNGISKYSKYVVYSKIIPTNLHIIPLNIQNMMVPLWLVVGYTTLPIEYYELIEIIMVI